MTTPQPDEERWAIRGVSPEQVAVWITVFGYLALVIVAVSFIAAQAWNAS